MTMRSYGITMIIYGVIVMVQGGERWNNATYRGAKALADQAWWGIIATLLGVLILVGSLLAIKWLRNIGLYGTGLILCTLSVTILQSATMSPNVSYAGCAILIMVGVNAAIVANSTERRRI